MYIYANGCKGKDTAGRVWWCSDMLMSSSYNTWSSKGE